MICNSKYLLKKFPGKGGWTYAEIPEIKQNKKMPFGWVKVQGQIDDYHFKHVKLMPMGDGKLFLPVKKSIRKIIHKEAGDYVFVKLSLDDSSYTIPNELIDCLKDDSIETYYKFLQLSQSEQKQYVDWILEAKKDKTTIDRILRVIDLIKEAK